MALGDLPLWAQQLGGLILTIATAIGLTWSERRKRKVEPRTEASEVVAATFMERALVEKLTAQLVTTNSHLEKLNERMHEEDLARAVAARIRAEGGRA